MGENFMDISNLVDFYGNVVGFVLFGAITMTWAQSVVESAAQSAANRWVPAALRRRRRSR